MAIPTAQQASDKWLARLQQSTQQITDGVNAVQTAPGQLAAAQADLWLQRVQASKAKWQKNVAAVPLADWKAKMINVGIPRVSQGAAANQGKVTTFMNAFLPYLATGVARVNAMPKGTLQNSIDRAVAMITYNSQFPGA